MSTLRIITIRNRQDLDIVEESYSEVLARSGVSKAAWMQIVRLFELIFELEGPLQPIQPACQSPIPCEYFAECAVWPGTSPDPLLLCESHTRETLWHNPFAQAKPLNSWLLKEMDSRG